MFHNLLHKLRLKQDRQSFIIYHIILCCCNKKLSQDLNLEKF